MNRSRSHWSKDLKCCKKEVLFEPFILASSIVLSLPIFFYFGCYFYTKRLESRRRATQLINNTHSSQETHPGKETGSNSFCNSIAELSHSNNEDCEDILYKPERKSSRKSLVDIPDPGAGPSNAKI